MALAILQLCFALLCFALLCFALMCSSPLCAMSKLCHDHQVEVLEDEFWIHDLGVVNSWNDGESADASQLKHIHESRNPLI